MKAGFRPPHEASRRCSAARAEAVRIVKFIGGGAFNTLLGGGFILVLQSMAGWSPSLANAGGYALGIPSGYLLNRFFVFNENRGRQKRAPAYVAAVAAAFLANQAILALLSTFSTGPVWAAASQLAALATYTLTLFLLCRFWVFAPPARSDASAKLAFDRRA